MVPTIAIHLGAGKHSPTKNKDYKALCNKACKLGIKLLNDGVKCQQVVAQVGKVLEDSPLTNAGYGSNLNSNGQIECDACITDSETLRCTCVGAMSGILNPIMVANSLLDDLKSPIDRFGRAKPTVLVGDGALQYALGKGHEKVSTLETKDRIENYNKWKQIIDKSSFSYETEVTDTIGIICCDIYNDYCVGASSGGVLFKQPGRIGPAAIPGAGVCIKKQPTDESRVVCSCTTGNGEDILTCHLATLVCDSLLSHDLDEDAAYKHVFRSVLSNPRQRQQLQSDSYMGVLSLCSDSESAVLSYAHKTDSMIIGYASADSVTPKVIISRNTEPHGLTIGAAAFTLSTRSPNLGTQLE